VGFADRLLLAKTDLVGADRVEALSRRLARINPRAELQTMTFGDVDVRQLLELNGFRLDARLIIAPQGLDAGHAHHHDSIGSFVFRAHDDFDGQRLQDFLADLIRLYGPDLLRYKGVLAVDRLPRRVIVQGVHELLASSAGAPWGDDERASVMVFIGRDLPRGIIEQGLGKCLR
jgi:G3E family GTPase